jgi:hypothetical protein
MKGEASEYNQPRRSIIRPEVLPSRIYGSKRWSLEERVSEFNLFGFFSIIDVGEPADGWLQLRPCFYLHPSSSAVPTLPR